MFCKEVVGEILSGEKDVITNPKKKLSLFIVVAGRAFIISFFIEKKLQNLLKNFLIFRAVDDIIGVKF